MGTSKSASQAFRQNQLHHCYGELTLNPRTRFVSPDTFADFADFTKPPRFEMQAQTDVHGGHS